MLLQGKIAIVTGAGQGVGRGIANVLAREGAKVVIADLNGERAKAAADGILAKGGQAMAYPVDVLNMARGGGHGQGGPRHASRPAHSSQQCRGSQRQRPLCPSKEQDWDQDLGVGLKGYLICTRAVINHFLDQNYGRIISISSSAGKMGSPNLAAYSASKGAIIGFTKALARELAKTGVTVNSVAPGAVNTPMQDRLSEEFKAHMRSTIPMGRYSDPEEIGETVAFLASDRTDYVTGQV